MLRISIVGVEGTRRNLPVASRDSKDSSCGMEGMPITFLLWGGRDVKDSSCGKKECEGFLLWYGRDVKDSSCGKKECEGFLLWQEGM